MYDGPYPRPDDNAVGTDGRRLPDRRSGRDRRGCGRRRTNAMADRAADTAAEPRAYGFRDLDERRDRQDRRLYGLAGSARHRSRGAPAGQAVARDAAARSGAGADLRDGGDPPAGPREAPTAKPGEVAATAPKGGVLSLTHAQLRVLLERSED